MYRSIFLITGLLTLLAGCNATDDEKERIKQFEENVNTLVNKPTILSPANSAIVNSLVAVRLKPVEAEIFDRQTLVIEADDHTSISAAPYVFEWNPYFWSTKNSVTLTVRGEYQVQDSETLEVTQKKIYSDTTNVVLDTDTFKSLLTPTAADTYLPYGTREITVNWNATPYANTYDIRINNGEIQTLETTSTNITLGEEGTYSVEVRATDSYGNTGMWNSLPEITVMPPTAPTAELTYNQESLLADVQVTLSNDHKYNSVSLVANGNVVSTLTQPPYVFSWNPYFWTTENQLTWQIEATLSNDRVVPSMPYTFSNEEIKRLSQQIVVQPPASIIDIREAKQFFVEWNSPENSVSYEYRVNDTSFESITNSAFIDIDESKSYQVTVRSIDADGRKGLWSEPRTITIPTIEQIENGYLISTTWITLH